jgi:DNA gyrase subunit A
MPEQIQKQEITTELKKSYLDYAMSVIISRALPDARDGLKPVQRRILYGMKELGLWPNAKFTKSANIVGTILARYHPHGDSATYDALVRMAQDFSLRYPLIWGQGNMGSVDGDPAAAHRYTEAKFSKIAEEILSDIDKETVDFTANYDNTKKEPVVLPSKIPNLLINGSLGIAVGMATNIPPHNLTEIIDGLEKILSEPKTSIQELLAVIKGPDFPTGGLVFGKKSLAKCYKEGRGSIVVRAKVLFEETKRGESIVIIEIPWQVNKAELIKQIAVLALEKIIPEIKDVRDESSRGDIRIVIETKDAENKKVLEKLYRLTDLQKNYYFNLVALRNGIQPKLFDLKELLLSWLEHRKTVIYRRAKFDLKKAEERIHILEGLEKALANIDLVISIIKKSKHKEEAKENLIKKFKLSQKQAEAILELPLRTLTSLERERILKELEEKNQLSADLKKLLASPQKIEILIKKELKEIKEKYGDRRRTEIISEELKEEIRAIEKKDVILFINQKSLVKTFAIDTPFEKIIKDKENIGPLFLTNTQEKLWLASKNGKIFQVSVNNFYQETKYLESQILIDKGDKIIKTFMPAANDKFLFMITKSGLGKKIEIESALTQKRTGTQIVKLKNDEVKGVVSCDSKNNFLILTEKGLALAVKGNIPLQGRLAKGVKVIRLKEDNVWSVNVLEKDYVLFTFSAGFWKKISTKEFKPQNRGGVGVRVFELKEKIGNLIFAGSVDNEQEIIASNQKLLKIRLADIKLQKRNHQPQKLLEPIEKVIII